MLYPPTSLVKTVYERLVTDASTSSTSYVDMLSTSITLDVRASLICTFSVGAGPGSGTPNMNFQLLINDVAQQETKLKIQATTFSNNAMMFYETAQLDVGTHTAKIKWKTSGTSITCLASTNSDYHHAALLIEAVSV